MTLHQPVLLLFLFLLLGQTLSLVMPSTSSLLSPRFLFAYGHFLACGVLLLGMVRKGYIAQPAWLPVVLLSVAAVGLPAIKLYFS